MLDPENQEETSGIVRAWTGTLNTMYLESKRIMPSIMAMKHYINPYKMTMNERAARSWLKVCCIMEGEERIVTIVTRFESSPKTPRQENSTPSHQNSYSFQV